MVLFVFKICYFFFMALVLAVLEIQIEGPSGWAKNLPTWRPNPDKWFVRVFRWLSQDREFTGYHFFLMIFLLLMVHLPFVWTGEWSLYSELELMAFYVVFVVVWDFLWFVLNPDRSLGDFNSKNIWWHKRWFGGFPVDYYFGFLFAIILYIPLVMTDFGNILNLALLLFGNIVLVAITVLLYPKAY